MAGPDRWRQVIFCTGLMILRTPVSWENGSPTDTHVAFKAPSLGVPRGCTCDMCS